MNDINNRIKIGFILAVVAQAGIDCLGILYGLELYTHATIISSNALMLLSLIIILVLGPFILSIVALNYIRGEYPANGRERTFRLLAKIFSNITIIETAMVGFLFLIMFAFIGTIHIV